MYKFLTFAILGILFYRLVIKPFLGLDTKQKDKHIKNKGDYIEYEEVEE